jgi:glucoside 3-dehydrogenase (cytochrome c) hitch-hiker subunit
MNRREALRFLATGTALGLATPKIFATLRNARALVQTQAGPRTLSPHQNQTVTAIAEMIIPRTETPGATDAGVPAFIDLIVTEWYTDEQRARFLNGLVDVDARAQRRFNKEFVACSPHQESAILTELGAQMLSDAALTKAQPGFDGDPEPTDNFYQSLRNLILTGYYTSEAGATAELNYQIIPDHFDACADSGAGKEAEANR